MIGTTLKRENGDETFISRSEIDNLKATRQSWEGNSVVRHLLLY